MFENPRVDIMHDLNEGAFPFMMRNLFKYLIQSGLYSEDDLVQKMQYHDYGQLNKKNRPSAVNLEKANLNQSAAQSKCLLENLPFILSSDLDNALVKKVWACVQSLFEISQIVYSTRIEECDIVQLEKSIEIHLSSIQNLFRVELIAKHHFITHYPKI